MYDMDKTIEAATVSMQWHGAPTLVLVRGEGKKREVNTGDVVVVLLEQARELVKYSYNWTLEGDKPVVHGFEAAQKAAIARVEAAAKVAKAPKAAKAVATKLPTAAEKAAKKEADKAAKEAAAAAGTPAAPIAVTVADVEAMTTTDEVMAVLDSMDMKINPDASLEEMKSVLVEALTA
mgnify:CR=1 FL=1